MTRRLRWLAIGFLAVAACTGDSETIDTTSPEEPAGEGRLVILDDAGNIVVLDPDGANRIEMTSAGGVDTLYSQPTWSPDGQTIAWGQASADGFAVGYGTPEDGVEAILPTAGLPFYLYWSPDSSKVGILHSGRTVLEFEMVDTEAATSSVLSRGVPFYFAWSPESDRIAAHAELERFETITPTGGVVRLGATDQGYLNPFWTDSGILHVLGNELVVLDGEDTRRVVEVGGFTSFVVAPTGDKLAVQPVNVGRGQMVSLVEAQAVHSDVVTVVDIESAETEVITDEPALAFFWSPNGESLLLMTPRSGGLEMQVWTEGEGITDFGEFAPSPILAREMLPFFSQYAPSMSLWSPDSSSFAYPDLNGIWIQPLDGSEPALVSTGGWVAWSR